MMIIMLMMRPEIGSARTASAFNDRIDQRQRRDRGWAQIMNARKRLI